MGPSLNESGLYLHRLDGVVALDNKQDEEIVNGCLQRQKLQSKSAWLSTICCCIVLIGLPDCQGEGRIAKRVFVSLFLARGSKKWDIHTVEVVSKFKAFCHDKRNLYSHAHPSGVLRGASKSPAAKEGTTLPFLSEE